MMRRPKFLVVRRRERALRRGAELVLQAEALEKARAFGAWPRETEQFLDEAEQMARLRASLLLQDAAGWDRRLP